MDVVVDPNSNLQNPLIMAIAVGIISEGRVLLLHLGPPCSSFSVALNSAQASAVRSAVPPFGAARTPGLQTGKGAIWKRVSGGHGGTGVSPGPTWPLSAV